MSIDKNTNEGKNYRNNVVKSTPGTSKSRINTGFPENISVLSPMMCEYLKTKEEYKDSATSAIFIQNHCVHRTDQIRH